MPGRGQGYIRSQGKGRWEVVVSAGSDSLTGKRRRVSRIVHGRKEDAVRALHDLHAEVDRTRGSQSTLGALLAEYLRVTNLSPTTRDDYLRARRQMLPDSLSATPLWKLRANDLDSLYAALRRDGWTPDRIIRLHTLLSAAFSRAVKWGWLTRNVAADATPPSNPRRRVKPPATADVNALLDAAEPEFALYLRLAFVTGARRGELCGLRWGDVESARGPLGAVGERGNSGSPRLATEHSPPSVRLWIRRNVVYTSTSGLQVKSTKSGRERVVVLDSTTAAFLESHWADLAAARPRRLGPLCSECYVFSHAADNHTPWLPNYASKTFKVLRQRLGLSDDVHLHGFRHASASYALRAGFEMAVVSKRLGHARQSTTSDLYSHVVDDRDSEAAASLAGLLLTDRGQNFEVRFDRNGKC